MTQILTYIVAVTLARRRRGRIVRHVRISMRDDTVLAERRAESDTLEQVSQHDIRFKHIENDVTGLQ